MKVKITFDVKREDIREMASELKQNPRTMAQYNSIARVWINMAVRAAIEDLRLWPFEEPEETIR